MCSKKIPAAAAAGTFLHKSAEHVDQDTGRNRGTDNAGHVGAHGMHEQVVGGVVLLADLLADAGRHRHGGHARGTDEGVDLAAGDDAHDLAQDDAARGAHTESHDAQDDDLHGLDVQEGGGVGGAAHREAQENGDNIHQLIAGSLGDTLHHAAFFHQVAHHQAAHQDGRVGQGQRNNDGNNDREKDLFGLGDLTRGGHNDLAFFFRSKYPHDGRLDDRHQRHVTVGCHRDGTQQMGRQTGGGEDGGGAVGTADDADGSGFRPGEAQDLGADEGEEDTQLGRSAQQKAGGTGDQRGEVGHGADAQEDQRRVNAQLDAQVDVVHHAAGVAQHFPVDVVGLIEENLDVEDAVQGQVGHEHAEADGQQQQRFELLDDGQVQQHAGNRQHDGVFPAAVGEENLCPAGIGENFRNIGDNRTHGSAPLT